MEPGFYDIFLFFLHFIILGEKKEYAYTCDRRVGLIVRRSGYSSKEKKKKKKKEKKSRLNPLWPVMMDDSASTHEWMSTCIYVSACPCIVMGLCKSVKGYKLL